MADSWERGNWVHSPAMPSTSALFSSIQDAGYVVEIKEMAGSGLEFSARKIDGEERHVATARADDEEGIYRAWVELAQSVGIDVEDG